MQIVDRASYDRAMRAYTQARETGRTYTAYAPFTATLEAVKAGGRKMLMKVFREKGTDHIRFERAPA